MLGEIAHTQLIMEPTQAQVSEFFMRSDLLIALKAYCVDLERVAFIGWKKSTLRKRTKGMPGCLTNRQNQFDQIRQFLKVLRDKIFDKSWPVWKTSILCKMWPLLSQLWETIWLLFTPNIWSHWSKDSLVKNQLQIYGL